MAIALSELNTPHPELTAQYYTQNPESMPLQPDQRGDLAHHDHATQVEVINRALMRYVSFHEEAIAEGLYPDTALEKAGELQAGIQTLRETLSREKTSENYQRIKAKYEEADRESIGKSPAERFAHRLSKFKKLRVVTDFDGTITTNPDDYLLRIPGSIIAENLLDRHGREAFAHTAAVSWMCALEKAPETFRQVGREAELRDGVGEFLTSLDQLNVQDVTVLSANFEPIVMGGLDQLGDKADGVRVLAITPNDIRSTDKGTMLSLLALEDPDAAVIFLGDGSSDEAALSAHKTIAGFGALHDAGFAKQLKEYNDAGTAAPYFTYGNYHDVGVQLRLAQARAKLLVT